MKRPLYSPGWFLSYEQVIWDDLAFAMMIISSSRHLIISSSRHLGHYQQIKRRIGEAPQVAIRNTESLLLQRFSWLSFLIDFLQRFSWLKLKQAWWEKVLLWWLFLLTSEKTKLAWLRRKCGTNTEQIRCKHSTKRVKIQCKKGANTFKIWCKYSAKKAQIQCKKGANMVQIHWNYGANTVQKRRKYGANTVQVYQSYH